MYHRLGKDATKYIETRLLLLYMVIVRQRKAEHFKDYVTFSASLLDECGFLLPGANFRELDIFF